MSESAALSESQASEPSAAVGLALGAALCAVAVVPAALRSGAFVTAWLVLLGSAALPVGLFAAALRNLGVRSRAVGTVLLALALSSAPLEVLARVLKATTHHRPLGGVTFAIIALFVLFGAAAVAARLLSWGRDGTKKHIVLAIGVFAALAGARFVLAAVGGQAGFIRSAVLDGALLAAAGFAGGLLPGVPRRSPGRARRFGTVIWARRWLWASLLCFAHARPSGPRQSCRARHVRRFLPIRPLICGVTSGGDGSARSLAQDPRCSGMMCSR